MSTFKPGDRVRCVHDSGAAFVAGSLHTLYAVKGPYVYLDKSEYDNRRGWNTTRFELVQRAPRLTPPQHRAKVGTFPFLTEHRVVHVDTGRTSCRASHQSPRKPRHQREDVASIEAEILDADLSEGGW